jgi:hypothetical protein
MEIASVYLCVSINFGGFAKNGCLPMPIPYLKHLLTRPFSLEQGKDRSRKVATKEFLTITTFKSLAHINKMKNRIHLYYGLFLILVVLSCNRKGKAESGKTSMVDTIQTVTDSVKVDPYFSKSQTY